MISLGSTVPVPCSAARTVFAACAACVLFGSWPPSQLIGLFLKAVQACRLLPTQNVYSAEDRLHRRSVCRDWRRLREKEFGIGEDGHVPYGIRPSEGGIFLVAQALSEMHPILFGCEWLLLVELPSLGRFLGRPTRHPDP